ncbi:TPA: ABC transporter ATP-binding protein [Candidatus Woesearchaeota archaeon]|nr:ABC transporter ATP-binding protein [Candidatus Woesearchaeota archaeon]
MSKKKHSIDFRYNLSIYFSLLKKYRGLFTVVLGIILVIEALSLVDKFLLKIVLDRGADYLAGTLSQNQFTSILITLLLVFAGVSAAEMLLRWLRHHTINILEGNLITDLKRKFFNHLMYLSYNFHTTHKTGSLISRLVRGGRSMETMTDVFIFNVAPLLFQLVVVGLSLFYFNWIPALILLITVVIFILYSYSIQELQREATVISNDAEDLEKAHIGDFFTNIESIKYFGKEHSIIARFKKISEKTKETIIRHWHYYRWLESGQQAIIGIGTIAILYFPLVDFIHGTITIGTLVFIYTAYSNMLVPMFGFVRGMRDYYRTMADFESLFQYGKIKNEIKDKPNAVDLKIKEGAIEFKGMSFRYQNKEIFSNFNLTIPKNHKVALVGPSGSGKTTLVKLLYRLYDVETGEIRIDGKNIQDFTQESVRSELSIVPQECILFDDTIYHNIVFSKLKASRQEVLQAIKFAQLDKVIDGFALKEKTIVGERGVRLSGGEKQRVSIARAILANKKVLLLDEATSALDSKTEHDIQKALHKLMQGRTTIIIAHRLSTIMQADTIIVMDKGKIIQRGKHEELSKQEGMYQKLWNLQKGGYIK